VFALHTATEQEKQQLQDVAGARGYQRD